MSRANQNEPDYSILVKSSKASTTSTLVSSSTQLEVSNSSVDLEESLEDRDEQHEIEVWL